MRAPPLIALADCDSFSASCEQVFRLDWQGRPLVVLGNNARQSPDTHTLCEQTVVSSHLTPERGPQS
jgi:hypothetical protein